MIIPPLNYFFERRFRVLEGEHYSAFAEYADGVIILHDLRLFGFAAKAGFELGVVLVEGHEKSRMKSKINFILPI